MNDLKRLLDVKLNSITLYRLMAFDSNSLRAKEIKS